MSERKELEDALAYYEKNYFVGVGDLAVIVKAARTHLDTLPSPKVKKWKVDARWARNGEPTNYAPYDTLADAEHFVAWLTTGEYIGYTIKNDVRIVEVEVEV